jgi:hypothetical protein
MYILRHQQVPYMSAGGSSHWFKRLYPVDCLVLYWTFEKIGFELRRILHSRTECEVFHELYFSSRADYGSLTW